MQEWFVRPMSPSNEDLSLFALAFERNGSSSRSLDLLRWQYLDNTVQKVFVDLADTNSTPRFAAIYASLPGWLRIHGEKRLALQSLDTLTDIDFRGRGLFLQLARNTFKRAQEDGAALIYGFPNGNSAHGFFTKLGWTSLDPVPFLIRPLRTKYVLEKLKKGVWSAQLPNISLAPRVPQSPKDLHIQESTFFDKSFSELWFEFAAPIGCALERDANYLSWRLSKPHENYQTLSLWKEKDLIAYVTFAVKEKHGGNIGYIMELIHRPYALGPARFLLNTALARMAKAKADVALAWNFSHSPNHLAYLSTGFVPFPERLRPIELHLGARAFDPNIASTITDRRRWYISYLDSDTV